MYTAAATCHLCESEFDLIEFGCTDFKYNDDVISFCPTCVEKIIRSTLSSLNSADDLKKNLTGDDESREEESCEKNSSEKSSEEESSEDESSEQESTDESSEQHTS